MDGDASASPAAGSPEPWKVLGRDTPAGKALFKLYNGNQGASKAGQDFHQRNKAAHQKKLASGWSPSKPAPTPQSVELERPTVVYPSFGRKPAATSEQAARLHAVPRRRPADQILAEIEQDKARERELLPPRPRGALLDDAEKDRLADHMRYRGPVPKATPEELQAAARHRGARGAPGGGRRAPPTRREELEGLFAAVSGEVDERKEFLAALEAAGELKRDTVVQVRDEIKSRVAELNRIDAMLRELDEE